MMHILFLFRYAILGKKLEGLRLLILDEIAMISLKSLYIIERTVAAAMATLAKTDEEKKAIESKPFGGLHVIFSGDLYQLASVKGTPVYSQDFGSNIVHQLGKKFGRKSMKCMSSVRTFESKWQA